MLQPKRDLEGPTMPDFILMIKKKRLFSIDPWDCKYHLQLHIQFYMKFKWFQQSKPYSYKTLASARMDESVKTQNPLISKIVLSMDEEYSDYLPCLNFCLEFPCSSSWWGKNWRSISISVVMMNIIKRPGKK